MANSETALNALRTALHIITIVTIMILFGIYALYATSVHHEATIKNEYELENSGVCEVKIPIGGKPRHNFGRMLISHAWIPGECFYMSATGYNILRLNMAVYLVAITVLFVAWRRLFTLDHSAL